MAELGITHQTLDEVSRVASGHSSKLLADPPIRGIGPMSLGPILGALGLRMVLSRIWLRWLPCDRGLSGARAACLLPTSIGA